MPWRTGSGSYLELGKAGEKVEWRGVDAPRLFRVFDQQVRSKDDRHTVVPVDPPLSGEGGEEAIHVRSGHPGHLRKVPLGHFGPDEYPGIDRLAMILGQIHQL